MVDPNTPEPSSETSEALLEQGADGGAAPAPEQLLKYLAALASEQAAEDNHPDSHADDHPDSSPVGTTAEARTLILRNLVKVAAPSVHLIEHRMLFDRNEVSGTELVDFTTPYLPVGEHSSSNDLGGSGDDLALSPSSSSDEHEERLVRDWLRAADDQERLFDELELVTGLRTEYQERASNSGSQQMVMDAEQHRLQSQAIAQTMKHSPVVMPIVLTVGEESHASEWEAIRFVEVGDVVIAIDPIDGSTLAQTTGQNYAVIYVMFEEVADEEYDDE